MAVGLALVRPPAPASCPAPQAASPHSPRPGVGGRPRRFPRLHVILPPNFIEGWKRGSVTATFEIEQNSTRKLLPKNISSLLKGGRQEDKDVLQYLFTSDSLAGMATLDGSSASKLFTVLAGHPRMTLGRGPKLEIQRNQTSLRLEASPEPNGSGLSLSVRLPADGETFVVADTAWNWCKKTLTLTLLAPGSANAIHRTVFGGAGAHIGGGPFPPFWCSRFRSFEGGFPLMWMGAGSTAVPLDVTPETPRLALEFEGSLNHLEATLQALYGNGRIVTIGVTDPREQFTFPRGKAPGQFSCRNVGCEDSARDRLRGYGFRGPDTRGAYALDGQDAILRFFATGVPELQKEWEVRTGARFQRITDQQVEVVRPRFEIQSSGENWLDLGVSLVATRSGQRFTPSEMARLLEMGRGHQRLPNGRIAVFPAQSVEDLQQVLLDCDASQSQGRDATACRAGTPPISTPRCASSGFNRRVGRRCAAGNVGSRRPRRWICRPRSRLACAPTSAKASPGSIFSPATTSAACWPMKWDWARPCRRSPFSWHFADGRPPGRGRCWWSVPLR